MSRKQMTDQDEPKWGDKTSMAIQELVTIWGPEYSMSEEDLATVKRIARKYDLHWALLYGDFVEEDHAQTKEVTED